MDQPFPDKMDTKGFTKPIGGFIVVMIVAVFIGGWLYVDAVRSELDMKIEALSAQVAPSKEDAAKTVMLENGNNTVASWQTAPTGTYNFEYPSDWSRMIGSSSSYDIEFNDANNQSVAKYGCNPDFTPGVSSGYSIEVMTRSLIVDPSSSYEFTLTNATPMMGNKMQKPYSSILASHAGVKGDTPCYLYIEQQLPQDTLMHMWRSFVPSK